MTRSRVRQGGKEGESQAGSCVVDATRVRMERRGARATDPNETEGLMVVVCSCYVFGVGRCYRSVTRRARRAATACTVASDPPFTWRGTRR